jgi:hypothetical protein
MVKSGKAVMENVRRYRTIASLHRQTAAFRPVQCWSLLDQAELWERLAVAELEAYFDDCGGRHDDQGSPAVGYAEARRETARGSESDTLYMRAPARWQSATALAA